MGSSDESLVWKGLNAEIDLFLNRSHRSGLTRWALVGALTTIAIYSVDALAAADAIDWSLFATAGYGTILLLFAPTFSRHLASQRESSERPRAQIVEARIASRTHFGAAVYCGIVFAGTGLLLPAPWWGLRVVAALPGVLFVLTPFMLAVSLRMNQFHTTLMPDATRTSLGQKATMFVVVVVSPVTSWVVTVAACRSEWSAVEVFEGAELRLAVAVVVAGLLLRALAAVSRDGHVLTELVRLRRAIYLEDLSATEAKMRIEVVLLGQSLGTLLEQDVSSLQGIANEVGAGHGRVEALLESARVLLDDHAEAGAPEARALAIASVLRSAESELSQATSELNGTMSSHARKLKHSIEAWSRLGGASVGDEARNAKSKIDTVVEEMRGSNASLHVRLEEARSRLSATPAQDVVSDQ